MWAARNAFLTAGLAGGDPTVFLLSASGSTTIFDAGPNNLTVSRVNATATTAETNFTGKYSIYFNGSSYLLLPADPVFDFGTGDFTVELWVRPANIDGFQHFGLWLSDQSVNWLGFRSNGNALQIFIGGTWLGGADVLTAGEWQHVAASRSGSTVRLFRNGVEVATFTGAQSAATGGVQPIIGAVDTRPFHPFEGHIQDLRISNTALYTGNFTPPGSLT